MKKKLGRKKYYSEDFKESRVRQKKKKQKENTYSNGSNVIINNQLLN